MSGSPAYRSSQALSAPISASDDALSLDASDDGLDDDSYEASEQQRIADAQANQLLHEANQAFQRRVQMATANFDRSVLWTMANAPGDERLRDLVTLLARDNFPSNLEGLDWEKFAEAESLLLRATAEDHLSLASYLTKLSHTVDRMSSQIVDLEATVAKLSGQVDGKQARSNLDRVLPKMAVFNGAKGENIEQWFDLAEDILTSNKINRAEWLNILVTHLRGDARHKWTLLAPKPTTWDGFKDK